jgi:predicted transcriptional regulator
LAYNEWLEAKVSESIAAVERGETVANEEVCGWIERREAESADSEFKPSQILRERR